MTPYHNNHETLFFLHCIFLNLFILPSPTKMDLLPRDNKNRLKGDFREVFYLLDNLCVDESTPFTSLLHSHLEIEDIRILLDQCYQCQCCARHQHNRGVVRPDSHHVSAHDDHDCQCVCRHFSRWLERIVEWDD